MYFFRRIKINYKFNCKMNFWKIGNDEFFDYYKNENVIEINENELKSYNKVLSDKKNLNIQIESFSFEVKKKSIIKIMNLSKSEIFEHILFIYYKNKPFKNYNDMVNNNHLKNQKFIEINTNIIPNLNLYLKNNNTENKFKNNNKNNKKLKTNIIENPLEKELNEDNNYHEKLNLDENEKKDISLNLTMDSINTNENIVFTKSDEFSKLTEHTVLGILLKWIYLILAIIGFIDINYFLYCKIKGFENELFLFYIIFLGLILILLGFYGFRKTNFSDLNDYKIIIFNITSLFFSIICIFIGENSKNEKIKSNWFIGFIIYFSLLIEVFCIVLIILIRKIKIYESENNSINKKKISLLNE